MYSKSFFTKLNLPLSLSRFRLSSIILICFFYSCVAPYKFNGKSMMPKTIGMILQYKNHSNSRSAIILNIPETENLIRVSITQEKLNPLQVFFSNLRFNKNEKLKDSSLHAYNKIKFKMLEVEKFLQATLSNRLNDLNENKTYGIISSNSFLVLKEEVKLLLNARSIYLIKSNSEMYTLDLLDSLGVKSRLLLDKTFLIEYEAKQLCINKYPFGQEKRIGLSTTAKSCLNKTKRRKKIKSFLK